MEGVFLEGDLPSKFRSLRSGQAMGHFMCERYTKNWKRYSVFQLFPLETGRGNRRDPQTKLEIELPAGSRAGKGKKKQTLESNYRFLLYYLELRRQRSVRLGDCRLRCLGVW